MFHESLSLSKSRRSPSSKTVYVRHKSGRVFPSGFFSTHYMHLMKQMAGRLKPRYLGYHRPSPVGHLQVGIVPPPKTPLGKRCSKCHSPISARAFCTCHLVIEYNPTVYYCWIQCANVSLMSIFFLRCLFGVGIGTMLVSKNEFGRVPLSSIFWNSLRRIDINSFNVW